MNARIHQYSELRRNYVLPDGRGYDLEVSLEYKDNYSRIQVVAFLNGKPVYAEEWKNRDFAWQQGQIFNAVRSNLLLNGFAALEKALVGKAVSLYTVSG